MDNYNNHVGHQMPQNLDQIDEFGEIPEADQNANGAVGNGFQDEVDVMGNENGDQVFYENMYNVPHADFGNDIPPAIGNIPNNHEINAQAAQPEIHIENQ